MSELDERAVLLRNDPVLTTESRGEYKALQEQFFREVQPCDFVERIYAKEFLDLNWEILRLRRCKAAIVDSVRVVALKDLLVLGEGEMYGSHTKERDLAVRHGQNDAAARQQVALLLKSRGLDESAIESEAIRIRLDDLVKLDRMITSLEARRDKTLLKISDYRSYFGEMLKSAQVLLLGGTAPTHDAKGQAQVLTAAE